MGTLKTTFTIILLLFLGYSDLFSQISESPKTKLKGYAFDQKNIPLPFVSVALMQDNNPLTGAVTDEKGSFQLIWNFTQNTNYTIKLSSIGYISQIKSFTYPDTAILSHLTLTADNKTLNAVTITAKRPLIVRKADRYIVDVENSFLSQGNTGLEVLQKSPGIWVNPNGGISINGNQSVRVMINDVVQRMGAEELADYLRTLKSENISKIEVISNPPSEFEASGSGGIIHIILKKAREDGLLASIFTQYRQQNKKPYASAGTTFDYKIRNLYFLGSASYTKDKSYYLANYTITYPNSSVYQSATDRNNNNDRTQYRFGIAYDISKTQSIGIQTIGAFSKLVQSFDTGIDYTTGATVTSGLANSNWLRKPEVNSSTLNYSWKIDTLGSTLKVIADYTNSRKSETNHYSAVYNDPSQNSIYRTLTPNNTNNYSLQTDYKKVLKNKLQLTGGVKYTATQRDNELINEKFINNNWVLNTGRSNRFIYDESLLMGYTSIEKAIKRTSIKAGLRWEQTYVKGNSITSGEQFIRQYSGLFPSLFITQAFDEKQSNVLRLNYSRRLQRPAFNELNPYRLQIDDYLVIIGNPDLAPQYTHNIELGFNFKDGYSAELIFSTTEDVIAQLANPINNNLLEYQYRNFDKSTAYGFNINAPFTIKKFWTINNGFTLYYLSYGINGFTNKQTSFSAKSAHTFKFKHELNMDIYAEYRSPYVNANSRVAYSLYTDLGFSKRLLANKARLRLSISDPLNTAREKDITEYNNTRIEFYQKRPTRSLNLGFSYSLSTGKKFSNKKIDSGNSDERNRIEGG